jgi:23S rRNA (guanosine2251-2'-O)-methyltransferase
VIVYGRNPVREALRGRREVTETWATDAAAREEWLEATHPRRASDRELEDMCGSPDHQGVCAEAGDYPYVDPLSLLDADDALVLCLDEIQDPRNLGAICRVAEVAGASGVVIGERRSAQVTPVVCKTSAGAVEHLPVGRVRNLAEYLGEAKQDGAWVYGASAEEAVPYDQPDYTGKVLVVLGAEGRGLRPRVKAACDQLIALPVRGRVDSLNVSAAASAIVYGILHFRGLSVDNAP